MQYEKQYRQAVMNESIVVYQVNFSKDLIEEEFSQHVTDDEEVKVYQNGSTEETVFSDTNCTNKIGSLNKYEQCDCLGIFQNRAIVRYKIDNQNNYKVGFVKYLGGVK